MKRFVTILATALAIAALPVFGGTAETYSGPGVPPARPRVGLVLSGGGARGAAHVGVLKVLEELRVPVDIVAGTSMGSIVGGLYATGMPPAEMQKVLETIDWDDAFDDDVPRTELPIRRKEDRSLFLVGLSLGIEKGKISLPSGLVAGQKLNWILRTLTLPSALVDDFDRLPIPFRTVATDAATGHKVVLRRGSVADAIRASMAFPGLFAPVEVGGALLVDGGVAENLPVETAREAGADVLIAVDIGTPAAPKEALGDLLKILSQTTSAAANLNVERSRLALRTTDVFIEPALGDLSFLGFTRAREAIDLGEAAARAAADRLREFSVSEEEWTAWLARTCRLQQSPPRIDRVVVSNTSRVSDEIVRSRVRSVPGPLDLPVLRADLARLYALQEFDLVDFRIRSEGGLQVLEIVTTDKKWGHTRVRFGLDLRTDFRGDSTFQFDVGIIRTSVNRLGAEWRLTGGIGEREVLVGEFYQPLVASGALFVSPYVGWKTDLLHIGIGDTGVFADYTRRELTGGFDGGIGFGTLGELRVGIQRGYLWADPRTGDALPDVRLDRGAVVGGLYLDSRDDINFPRTGAALQVTGRWESPALGADQSFRKLDAFGTAAWSRGKDTLQLMAIGATPLGTTPNYFDYSFLGGFRRLSGYRPGELAGPYAAFGSVTYLREVGRLPAILGGSFHAGLGLEAGNAWTRGADVSLSDLHPSGIAFVGGNTPLGPVNVGVGIADAGHWAIYFNLGRVF